MARGNQRNQGREGGRWQGSQQGGGRGPQAEREERGRWGSEPRGEPSWRPDYGAQGDRERDYQARYGRGPSGPGGYGPGDYDRGDRDFDGRQYTGGSFGRGETARGEYGRAGYDRGEYSGAQYGRGYGRERQPESYSDLDRWERRPIDMGPDRGGGAYAGGSYGGGAYGPGGFGGSSTDQHWVGAAGSGHAPDWTEERERRGERWDRPTHSGRGPKGYQRSGERITEDVCEALTRHPDIDATDISVRCENGEVILSGTVGDRREKRMAEDAAERIAGVMDVRNEIRVNRASEEEEMRRAPSGSRGRPGPKG